MYRLPTFIVSLFDLISPETFLFFLCYLNFDYVMKSRMSLGCSTLIHPLSVVLIRSKLLDCILGNI